MMVGFWWVIEFRVIGEFVLGYENYGLVSDRMCLLYPSIILLVFIDYFWVFTLSSVMILPSFLDLYFGLGTDSIFWGATKNWVYLLGSSWVELCFLNSNSDFFMGWCCCTACETTPIPGFLLLSSLKGISLTC